MNRAERRRATRAIAKQAVSELSVRVQVRRTWAVALASFVARVPMRTRLKARLCTRIVRLAQMRVGLGPWRHLPVEITP